jgi:hypothetical protein
MTTFNRKAAFTAIYTERYVLSLVFLYLAWIKFHKPWASWAGWAGQPFSERLVFKICETRLLTDDKIVM